MVSAELAETPQIVVKINRELGLLLKGRQSCQFFAPGLGISVPTFDVRFSLPIIGYTIRRPQFQRISKHRSASTEVPYIEVDPKNWAP